LRDHTLQSNYKLFVFQTLFSGYGEDPSWWVGVPNWYYVVHLYVSLFISLKIECSNLMIPYFFYVRQVVSRFFRPLFGQAIQCHCCSGIIIAFTLGFQLLTCTAKVIV
jgi:hypothetical protein